VIGTNAEVVSPMSPPNVVLFFARAPGDARVDIVTGDPWHGHGTTTTALDVHVEPAEHVRPAAPEQIGSTEYGTDWDPALDPDITL
jgi:hypothetical protein